MVVRPERAFSVLARHRPVFDLALISVAAWLVVVAAGGVGLLRYASSLSAPGPFLEDFAVRSSGSFVLALVVSVIYAVTTGIASRSYGTTVDWGGLMISFWGAAAISLAIAALPAAVLRFAEYGEMETPFAEAIITLVPWLYIVGLQFIAVRKILKIQIPSAIVFMVLGALPLLLAFVTSRMLLPDGLFPGLIW